MSSWAWVSLMRLSGVCSNLGYRTSVFNKLVRRYGYPAGFDEFSGYAESIMNMPFVSEPGSRWEYSVCVIQDNQLFKRTNHLSLYVSPKAKLTSTYRQARTG